MAKKQLDENFGKVSKVNIILTVIENVGFLIFGKWNFTVLLGSLWGLLMTTRFFYSICVSVPRALSTDDPDIATKRLRASQLERTEILAVGVFIALKVQFLYWPAALIPLLFTRISITLLHLDREED